MSSYFTFPGTGNWGSGSTNTNNKTSTTTKYFDPAAILAMQKYYGTQLGGYSSLNNSILYGKNAPNTNAPSGAPPVTTPPVTTPPVTTPPVTTPPVTNPPPDGTKPVGGKGGPLTPVPTTDPLATSHGEVPAASSMKVVLNPDNGGGTPGGAPVDSGGGPPPVVPTVPPATDPGLGHQPVVQGPTSTPVSHTTPTTTPATTPTTTPTTTPDPSGGDTPTGSGDGLVSALQQLLAGGGYSDAEKQAITENAAEALAAQKGSSQAQMASHLASSGNAAGYGGAMSSLDNSAAQTASDQARQNQIDFANEGERRSELGASGLTSLLGINTAAQLGTSGQAAGLASLGGGTDTSTAGNSNFQNQNFQATPDASTKPGTTPGVSTGKSGQDATGKKPGDPNYDPKTDPGSKDYDPKKDPLNAEYDPYLDPKNKLYDPNIGTDAEGNHPGEPNYDPTTDKTNAEYDPTHDPSDPNYDPYYTPGGVLPDPNPDYNPGDGGIVPGTEPPPDPPPDAPPDPPPIDSTSGTPTSYLEVLKKLGLM